MNDGTERHPDVVESRTAEGVPILKSFRDTMILKAAVSEEYNVYNPRPLTRDNGEVYGHIDIFDRANSESKDYSRKDPMFRRPPIEGEPLDDVGIDELNEEHDSPEITDNNYEPFIEAYDSDVDEFGFSNKKSAKPIKNLIGERRKNWSTCIDALHDSNGTNSSSKATAGDWVSQDEAKAVKVTNTPTNMTPVKKD